MKRSSPSRRHPRRTPAPNGRRLIKGFQSEPEDSQFRRLAARIESIQEEERKRVALEVHDELGQALTGLKLDLAWIMSRIKRDPELLRRARAMSRLIDRTVETARRIATELRPGILDQLGLLAAIEWQAQQFEMQTGIRTACGIEDRGASFAIVPSVAIFRIVQEVLTNVAHHARASKVEITVGSSTRNLFIEIQDNGVGMTASGQSESLGILGMRERAYLLAGSIEFDGPRGRGTRVSLTVPLSSLAL
jgi:signal transduction histidine kinase